MKKLGSILLLIILSGCAKDFVKRNATFTTLFSPGDTTFYAMHIIRNITVREHDSIKNYKMSYNFLIRENVEEVSSDFITLILTIKNATGVATFKTGAISEPISTDVFNKLNNHKLLVRLTQDGSIAYIKGTENIPTLLGTIAEELSDVEAFSILYDYLRPGKMKPGDIFRKETRSGSKVFKYEGVDKTKYKNGAALITFKSTFVSQGAGYKGTYAYKETAKGSGSGNIYHIFSDGRIFHGEEKFTLNDKFVFQGFNNLNKEVMVYTEVTVSRAQKTGGKEHE